MLRDRQISRATKGSVASFRLSQFVVWSLPSTHGAKEARDDGDQLQRGAFSSRHYSDGCPLVCRLPLEHAPRRRTHARTWGPRGSLDHQPVGGQYRPQLEEAFHRRKCPVLVSWRMDQTYIKVKGQWYYLYRAVDKHGQTIDFLLMEHRDTEAALRFLKKAIRRNGLPETITIDGSDANEAAMKRYNEEYGTAIAI